ncbi:NUDIX domain-containing protein [Streptomyces graminilatus]|uniref:NUDIX domain-containing protein n=1 Tax=Streptomyces graminilatus TaxID=1464070 RepID=UPI001F51CDD2|nr:NUDIX hydrolase [Streptomyces graminilatus]
MPEPAARPLAVDGRGNALNSFSRLSEEEPPGDVPLPLALVALWHGDRVLMVFDRHRRSWELPGGLIEPGESPCQAGLRELLEETGQTPEEPLQFVGYARFTLAPDQRAEYGALFSSRVTEVHDFQPNEEIEAVCWWDLLETLPGHVQPLDAFLARLTQDRGSDATPRSDR